MNKNISEFLNIIKDRGFIFQSTDLDLVRESKEKLTAYIGFDCTAPSLHVGSLIQIMLLRWLQKTQNNPIILIGGGTTKIGDPSGKDASRKILSSRKIEENATGIKNVFKNFINFDDVSNPALMVNNSDWLEELNYIEFLREYGQHFSINRMLSFDSVKLRLDRQQTLSFLEFNYMIIQAYDFLELNNRYNCNMQIGGSDQWGNIINGIELVRKVNSLKNKSTSLHAITSPLITKSSGEKMGKSSEGAIWLSKGLLSSYHYWQFWRNTEDKDVIKFLKLFTEIDLNEISKLAKLQGSEINDAKIILANATTEMAHGKDAANEASQSALNIFEKKHIDKKIPTINIDRFIIKKGIPAFKLFAYDEILCKSLGEARRLIRQGGAKINNIKILDENKIINESILDSNNNAQLSAGAKRHVTLKAT